MTIDATVQHGIIKLPPDSNLPDGTQVKIIVLQDGEEKATPKKPIKLHTFKGDGLRPGIDPNNPKALREAADDLSKFSQFP